MIPPSYLHPLKWQGETLPTQFTFPFRYTPHPLCVSAAGRVQQQLCEMDIHEGKMFGVLIVSPLPPDLLNTAVSPDLFFLAAYSGQLEGSYTHPWFVPPIVDYLAPESHFQQEQAVIVKMGKRLQAMRDSEQRTCWQQRVQQLKAEREAAVAEAKRVYAEGKRDDLPNTSADPSYIRMRQYQKANIQRAKQLHKEAIAEAEGWLAAHNTATHEVYEERKRRSEQLQQWLFEQFVFLNARREQKGLLQIFEAGRVPSGAGECCAPKLLQTAYQLGLQPLAMAEFWWGPSQPGHYREPGAFFPSCRSKCHPILMHMLQGLNVEPDPALHYDQVLKPIRVLWEDEHLAVLCKPEGWCSIPGRSDQANLLDEAHRLWPGITGSVVVHRLDQDTSGVMVIAKNAHVHRALCQQFERREVQKRYVALLEGELEEEAGRIHELSLPLGPDLENMPRQQVDHEQGKEALTRYEIRNIEERDGQRVTRVVFYPLTGRTHQLRVHAASPEGLNHPIVGDRLYGHVNARLYLHAEMLTFTHPLTHQKMCFEEPAPF